MENQINEIISKRRSIYPKEYNGQKLDNAVIDILIRNANFAPNHKSNYPWRFTVIQDESIPKWIDKAAEIYKQETGQEKFNQGKYNKTLGYKSQISHAIAIVMSREEGSAGILNEDICAVAAAVQNMYLSLSQFEHAAGYWSTGLGTYSKAMHTFLGLGKDDTLMGYFVLGCVDVKRTEGKRRDHNHFVRYL